MFSSVRQPGNSSRQYTTICAEAEHLVQSDATTRQAKSGKHGKPPRPPNPPNMGAARGPDDGRTKQLGGVSRPPRPDPPANVGGRGPIGDGPKQLGGVSRPPRPDLPANVGGRGPTDGGPKQLGGVSRPPRPDPPANVGGQGRTDGGPKQLGGVSRPPRPDPPANVGGRGQTDGGPKQLGGVSRPPRPDPPANVGGRGQTDGGPKQLGGVSRPPRPDPPANVGGRVPTDGPSKQLGNILRPPRPPPPSSKVGGASKAGEATQSNIPAGGKLSDARRKQLGDTFRPQRPDPPFGVGNRRVNEDSPKIIFGQVTKITENSPKKQPGSPVMDPANIKLPKRRSSHKSPGTPLDTEGSRVAALRQRLLDMQNMQGKESRRVSILISKSEGNVAKKTRSLEDKVMIISPLCGKHRSFDEFVRANKEKSILIGWRQTLTIAPLNRIRLFARKNPQVSRFSTWRIGSREQAKSGCDWLVMSSRFVASQSSCFFLCSREQIRQVESRLKVADYIKKFQPGC